MEQVGQICDCLEAFGIQISFDKTAILFKLEGPGAKAIPKQFVVHQHGQKWLRIPRKNGHTLIKIVPSHTYLGTKLSFLNFEQLTVKHRLHLGKITYSRMRTWFTGKRTLTSQDRADLWSTCILSSYAHGLGSSGLRQDGLVLLCRTINANIRSLARSPKHITHESNEHIRQRLRLHDPRGLFQDRWTAAFTKFDRDRAGLPLDDYLHRIPIQQIKIRVLTVFQETSQSPPDLQHPAEPIEVAFPCPYFSLVVDTAELLKRRLTKKRKAHPLYTRFVSLSDSLKGRP